MRMRLLQQAAADDHGDRAFQLQRRSRRLVSDDLLGKRGYQHVACRVIERRVRLPAGQDVVAHLRRQLRADVAHISQHLQHDGVTEPLEMLRVRLALLVFGYRPHGYLLPVRF